MKPWIILTFLCTNLLLSTRVLGIVPKPGTPLEHYEQPAKSMNNIGRLMVQGKKTSSCSSALIGIDGDIGIVLTAGHCADLTQEEEVKKCRFQTISFASEDTHFDLNKMPIIGRAVIGKYVEKPGFIADIGVVFIDLRDGKVNASPLNIALNSEMIPKKSLVQIAGYGKTSVIDELRNPKRLVMSTEALRSEEHDHDILWLDENGIGNQILAAPIGDHPAEGDSGAATINMGTGEIIGVVSHATNKKDYYSEPLYPHAEWLLAQIKNARRYLVFKPLRSGQFSDPGIWVNNHHKPLSFKNPYGELNPIVEIDGNMALSFDEEGTNIYAINMLGEGGALEIQTPEQYAEVLRVYAPTLITSSNSGKLVVETAKVHHSDFSLQAEMRILHELEIKEGVVMNTHLDNPMRGITLIENGNIRVNGNLKTHHVYFAPPTLESNSKFGCLYVSGIVELSEPIRHFAQTIQGTTSKHGEIKSDYTLGQKGILSFSLDTPTPSSSAILNIDGIAEFSGGAVSLDSPYILPVGFQQTLLSAKKLKILPAWRGMYNPQMVDLTSEITFIQKEAELIMKVVPIVGGSMTSVPTTNLDELFN